jgi:hypothetical protein
MTAAAQSKNRCVGQSTAVQFHFTFLLNPYGSVATVLSQNARQRVPFAIDIQSNTTLHLPKARSL